MKKIFSISIIFCLFISNVFADDFYWVNNGGDWSDYENHWAQSSGGSSMHARMPDSGDRVFFDENSFTTEGQLVSMDIDTINCAVMNWMSADFMPEFYGGSSHTLIIYDKLLLPTDDRMRFNFFGELIFNQSTTGQTLLFNTGDHVLEADVFIDINAGSLEVTGDMKLPQKKLTVYSGALDLAGYNLSVRHFNVAETFDTPAPVVSPELKNIDSLICGGSFHLPAAFITTDFSADIIFNAQSETQNYINTGAHYLDTRISITSGRDYYLLSDLHTSKEITMPMSGKFYSMDYAISALSLTSIGSRSRRIDLGSSELRLARFETSRTGLNLTAQNADLIYEGDTNLSFITNKTDIAFNSVSVSSDGSMNWSGSLQTNTLELVAGSKINFGAGSIVEFNQLTANGNCGNYIELRAQCSPNYGPEECNSPLPILRSANPITGEYLKLSFIEADGNFTADNSFDEGGNNGWVINEPTDESTLYWVGNSGDWNNSANWASVSGGAPQTCTPTKHSHLVFDDASFDGDNVVSLEGYAYAASVSWENLVVNPVWEGSGELYITDDIRLHSGLSFTYTGTLHLESNQTTYTQTIETNGVEIHTPVIINGDAKWDFVDPFVSNSDLVFEKGELLFSGLALSCNSFISEGDQNRIVNIENAAVELSGEMAVWDISETNANIFADGSEIILSNMSPTKKEFNGGGFDYGTLNILSDYAEIAGDNSFNLISAQAGHTLAFKSGSITSLDSLDAVGTCTEIVSLISDIAAEPAVMIKTGYDSLEVDYFFIQNIEAQANDDGIFEALNSTHQGNTTGWTFTAEPAGQDYYWLGNTTDWHDIDNWETGGLPATCLPNSNDHVIVDPVMFDSAPSTIIEINKNAYCASFTATGLNRALEMQIAQNLSVKESLTLDVNVNVKYSEDPDYATVGNYNYGIRLMPEGSALMLNPKSATIETNVYVSTSDAATKVILAADSPLLMGDLAALSILGGGFEAANPAQIQCGYLETLSNAPKTITMNSTDLTIANHLKFQDNSLLTFLGAGSSIQFNGNGQNFSLFEGGGQSFHNVEINGSVGDAVYDLVVILRGSNGFNNLSFNDGLYVFAEAGESQTVSGDFVIAGTCQNYVNISSSVPGSYSSFANDINASSVTCAILKDMQATSGTLAKLSFDEGNNAGWIFDDTQAAAASFTLPDPACVSEDLLFVNTSESIYGGVTNLNFDWEIGSSSVSNAQDLTYNFANSGDYTVSLTATDIITGCTDTHEETLSLEDHSIYLTVSAENNTICAGSTVTITANSDKATEFAFYLNDVYVDLGDPSIDTYVTANLNDDDIVRAEAIYNGCVKSSENEVFIVNPAPVIDLLCSESDTTICSGGTLEFIASGTQDYRFVLDGQYVSSFSPSNTYTLTAPADGSVVSVEGRNEYACIALSSNTYTVTVMPNPAVSLVADIDPATICSGDTLGFTASGADGYEFFLNGISMGNPLGGDYWETDLLQNSDIVTAQGTDDYGCQSISNPVSIIVNQSPDPVLSSDHPDNTLCLGESVNFYADGAMQYEFFIDGISQGPMSNTNTFSTDALTHLQTVSVAGQSGDCWRMSETDTFSVFPMIELEADLTEICPGETVSFTASGDTIYQFFVDGEPVSELENNPVFESDELTNGQTVSVSGTPGACLPNPISIIVRPSPQVSLSCSEADTTICNGDMLVFTASGASQYEFFIDGSGQGGPTASAQFVSENFTDGQTVSVLGYSNYGCTEFSSNMYTVAVNEYPDVSLSATVIGNELCADDTVFFQAGGADEYQFLVSGIPQTDFSETDNYMAYDLSGSPIFSVLGSTDGCVSEAPETFEYTVYELPNVILDAISPVSGCESDVISVEADGATEYEFFVNSVSQAPPSVNNIFEISTLSDLDTISVLGYQNICSAPAADSIVVNVNPIPDLSLSSNMGQDGLCYGETAIFTAEGAWEYLFYVDGLPYGDINTTGIFEISNLENGQQVSLTGFNNTCSRDLGEAVTAVIHDVDAELINTGETNSVCIGESVSFIASGGDMYEFFVNGNSTGPISAQNTLNLEVSSSEMLIWAEVIDNETSCSAFTPEYALHIADMPVITAIPDTEFCENDSVILYSNYDINNQWYYNSQMINGAVNDSYTAHFGGSYGLSVNNTEEGALLASGDNASGQLGDGTTEASLSGVRAEGENPFTQISAGESFVLAVDDQNFVYAWGNNAWGNLGFGNYSSVYSPTKVAVLSGIEEITAGRYHSLALSENGSVYSWGQNTYGQLGFGNYSSANFPMEISDLENITHTAAGSRHSIALDENGQVYAWGNNEFGQLGNGSLENNPSPAPVPGLDNIIFIAAGDFHNLAIDQDGKLWTWGRNENGQLGTGDLNTRTQAVKINEIYSLTQVTAGAMHSIGLSPRGEVYAWGSNADGRLGIAGISQSLLPLKVDIEGVASVNCGYHSSYVLKTDGNMWAWGLNNAGQLGNGNTQTAYEPIACENYFGLSDLAAGANFLLGLWIGNHSCDAETVDLTEISVPEVIIEANGTTLSTVAGVAYQWYFNGSVLPGATTQSITATAVGNYTVEVTFASGCTAISDVYSFSLDVRNWYSENFAQIYPNPNKGRFELILNMPAEVLDELQSYSLMSATGEIVKENKYFNALRSQHLRIDNLTAGAYYLVLKGKSGSLSLKVMVIK